MSCPHLRCSSRCVTAAPIWASPAHRRPWTACVAPLRRDAEGILVAATHPLAGMEMVELREVARHPVVLHPRSANPAHHDFVRDLFTSRDLHASFIERDIALDLSQRLITEGTAVEMVGQSAAVRLPPDVRWIPLAEPIAVTVALVLPTGERPAAVRRFEMVARAYAATHAWLDWSGTPEQASTGGRTR